jgi:transposase
MSFVKDFPRLVGSFDFVSNIKKESNGRMRTRLLALQNLKEGKKVVDICSHLKIARDRVRAWAKRFVSDGVDGLRELPGRGRKSKLLEHQKIAVAEFIEEKAKSNTGGRIFGKDIVSFISTTFGKKYSETSAYNLMHELGFGWITSRSIHPRCDKTAQEDFKKNLVPR